MLTIEQFANQELALLFSEQYVNGPLKFQSSLFQMLVMQGYIKDADPNVIALQFYAPIYFWMTVCDREPQREEEALQMLEKHIRQFNKLYKEEKYEDRNNTRAKS